MRRIILIAFPLICFLATGCLGVSTSAPDERIRSAVSVTPPPGVTADKFASEPPYARVPGLRGPNPVSETHTAPTGVIPASGGLSPPTPAEHTAQFGRPENVNVFARRDSGMVQRVVFRTGPLGPAVPPPEID